MNVQKIGDILIARACLGEISIKELQKYTKAESPYVRSCAAVALGKIKEPGRYDLWLTMLEDSEELVVGDAITSSAELNDSRCVVKLQELYMQKGYQIKTRVINALAQSQFPEAASILSDLQKEETNQALSGIIKEILQEMQK